MTSSGGDAAGSNDPAKQLDKIVSPRTHSSSRTSTLSIAPPRVPAELLRGDHAITASMEVLQVGYFHAVVAASRCSLGSPSPDRFLDYIVNHQSRSHTVDNEATLKVALKATTQVDIGSLRDRSSFSFKLKNEHLEYLAISNPIVPRVLVVMTLPTSIDEWTVAAHDALSIRHCCYWVNLEGETPTGKTDTSVKVSTAQIFDSEALCGMMQRIGRGGKP